MSSVVPPILLEEILDRNTLPKKGKILWKCLKNHEWEATLSLRIRGQNCPYCSNKRVLKEYNDLETVAPELAKEWHPTKNNILPSEIIYGSSKKAWWKCSKGHEWETKIESRYHKKSGCPVCSNLQVLSGFNDLASNFPSIAAEWHPNKNASLTPEQVTSGSHKKVWWKCNKNHEWETSISKRTSSKRNCPYCVNQKVLPGFNDLASKFPKLSSEWHPTKNGELTPEQVVSGSNKKVWWKCNKNHEWETSISKRTSSKRNCPYCANQKVMVAFNDLSTINPHLASQWHPTKNGELTPEQVVSGSNKKVWWKCNRGHEWETMPRERLKYGCPKCPTKASKAELEITSFLKNLNTNFIIENSVRKIIKGYELDIYVPQQKLAIEYNGLYWHGENQGRDKNYHHDKWKACKEQGIRLIQIWEDDWKRNPELIKNMLAYKMQVSVQEKIFARNTFVKEVSLEKARVFLNTFHIQGNVAGSIRIGLYEKTTLPKLVAVMVFKKDTENSLNLLRFATAKNVVGGFTKLLSYAEKQFTPEKIVTFSDNTVSNGELYKNNGFVKQADVLPDYMYVVKGERKHKFGYRLKRFRNDPELQYQENLTEKQLAELNDIPRIWDAGKVKWVKTVIYII